MEVCCRRHTTWNRVGQRAAKRTSDCAVFRDDALLWSLGLIVTIEEAHAEGDHV